MDFTLLLIKPNATVRNLSGEIIKIIEDNRFHIKHLKSISMAGGLAEKFYEEHQDKEFYDKLIEFMKSGRIIAAILEKCNAVEDLRKLVGSTDPAEADPGTIRYLYGETVRLNAVHASDCPKSAEREIKLIFPEL
jgi:nucleoside-diphosphate kinase